MHRNTLHLLLTQRPTTVFVKEGVRHYTAKIRPFADLKILEPRTEKKFAEQCQKLEKKTLTIVLEERGRQFNSESFAKTWETLIQQKARDISFLIGGPHGFPYQPRADLSLSLSNFTYNHELVPLVLLEQIYRAYSILKGLPYHHA